MYITMVLLVVFAVIGALSTMMALLNFMWMVALMSAVLTAGLLFGIDALTEVIK